MQALGILWLLGKARPRRSAGDRVPAVQSLRYLQALCLRFNDTIGRNLLMLVTDLTPHHRFNTRSQEELAVVTRDVRLPENPGQRLKA